MDGNEWKAKNVLERMKKCYEEASEIRNYSAEETAILAVGFYRAYESLYGPEKAQFIGF